MSLAVVHVDIELLVPNHLFKVEIRMETIKTDMARSAGTLKNYCLIVSAILLASYGPSSIYVLNLETSFSNFLVCVCTCCKPDKANLSSLGSFHPVPFKLDRYYSLYFHLCIHLTFTFPTTVTMASSYTWWIAINCHCCYSHFLSYQSRCTGVVQRSLTWLGSHVIPSSNWFNVTPNINYYGCRKLHACLCFIFISYLYLYS